ncbi:MAG: C-type lectin domain-containing protein [Methylovulum sp.]|uniref:C-type lectin domain-containing protein n=1 Tax=Methylovulum sp. TaxID=1916980 RepID=UPI00260784F6|nr:C-type lectin domain-containing protein [Methylovulum sp.]MDD2723113.1 C-type lectin domain-containing protein [Methylovulum sp.]MDD5123579.1 C-type lectin domain-containing protein [Methylovulum sp.]
MLSKQQINVSAGLILAQAIRKIALGGGAIVVGVLFTNSVLAADSAKILWNTNGHYYQRFERGSVIWSNAKTACASLSGHLATITSQEEQGFIYSKLLADRSTNNWYHIGGTDAASQFNWGWITGEPFSYEHWGYQEPDDRDGEDYLAMRGGTWSGIQGGWYDTFSSAEDFGYICEWSTQNYIGTALVPDLNKNGVDEIAGLFVDYKTGKHTVQIKDPLTDLVLSTLTFATNFLPPQGLVALEDINANGIPEIGVLYTYVSNGVEVPVVQIKDAKNNAVVLKNFVFLNSTFKAKAISASPDANGNGASEIVVLGIEKTTGKALAQIRDSKTGLYSNQAPF